MFATKDVSLAAYIRWRGVPLVEYELSRNGQEGVWKFDLEQKAAEQYKVDYANSDFAGFEGIRRAMAKQKYG